MRRSREGVALDIGGTKVSGGKVHIDRQGRFQLSTTAEVSTVGVRSLSQLMLRLSGPLPCVVTPLDFVSIASAGVIKGLQYEGNNFRVRWNAGPPRKRFGWREVLLGNDVERQVMYLRHPDCRPGKGVKLVRKGRRDPQGALGLLSIGTGCGGAALSKDGVLRAEPGISEIPRPVNATEERLLDFAVRKLGKDALVLETLVSGEGLALIDEFHYGKPVSSREVRKLLSRHPRTVSTWAHYLGHAVRQAICFFWATGGVYLYGGVLTRDPQLLENPRKPGELHPAFLGGLLENKWLRKDMAAVPIYRIVDPKAALKGIALATAETLQS